MTSFATDLIGRLVSVHRTYYTNDPTPFRLWVGSGFVRAVNVDKGLVTFLLETFAHGDDQYAAGELWSVDTGCSEYRFSLTDHPGTVTCDPRLAGTPYEYKPPAAPTPDDSDPIV